jgi:hypothetical protein
MSSESRSSTKLKNLSTSSLSLSILIKFIIRFASKSLNKINRLLRDFNDEIRHAALCMSKNKSHCFLLLSYLPF